MEVKTPIKSFPCKLHPSETVQRVLRSQDADNSLRCVECILANIDNAPKNAFVSLNDFIEEAVKHYASSHGSQTLEGAVPNDLVEFLSSEESDIEKLKQHVEKEKEKAIKVFDTLQQRFAALCQSKKQEVCQQLDHQVETMKVNYRHYESIIHKYYSKDTQEGDVDRDTLISKINECNDTNDLEVVLKSIKDDLQGVSNFINRYEATTMLKESLQIFSEDLKTIRKTCPKTSFVEENYQEEYLKRFNDLINPFLESCTEVTSKVEELTFNKGLTVNTKIFKPNDIQLIKKWIEPSFKSSQRLKLLYRASRDGFNLESFHRHCDNYTNTLIVVKEEEGKIYGGFSDQLWQDEELLGRQSSDSWLFSLSEKTKYKSWSGSTLPIRGSYGAGICFGICLDFGLIFSSDLGNFTHSFPSSKLSSHAYMIFRPQDYLNNTNSSNQNNILPMLSGQGLPGLLSSQLSQKPLSMNSQQGPLPIQRRQPPTQQLQMQQSQMQQLQMQQAQIQIQQARSSFMTSSRIQSTPQITKESIITNQQLQAITIEHMKQRKSTMPQMMGGMGNLLHKDPGAFTVKEIEVFYIVPAEDTP